MGLFFRFNSYGSMNDDMALAPKANDGKLYRLVQLLSISIFLIAVILVIFEIFQILPMSANTNGIVFSVGVLGLGGMVALPWVRVFEGFKDKRYKITAIVFLSIAGVCVILWIVCVWLIVGLIKKVTNDIDETVFKGLITSLNTIRASIIVSLQFVVSSYIAKNIIKYNKTLLPYQVLAGLSQLFLDFFLCLVLTAITITTKGMVEFSSTAYLLTNRWTYALLAIALVLGIFPSVVFRRTDRRNMMKYAAKDLKDIVNDDDGDKAENATATSDEKLQKIKELLDKGLITQEEYDKKREDIINSI